MRCAIWTATAISITSGAAEPLYPTEGSYREILEQISRK